MVADSGTRSLVAVTHPTGDRTLVSPNEPTDIGVPQRYSTGVALDLAANRIFVTDPLSQSLNRREPRDGRQDARVVEYDAVRPGVVVPNAVTIDAPNNRFLVVDIRRQAVYAVEFGTGARTVLSGSVANRRPVRLPPIR